MNTADCQFHARRLLLVVAAIVLALPAAAAETPANGQGNPAAAKGHPGPVALFVSGASAGIKTDYFEQTVTDAIATNGIFSAVESGKAAEVEMPMIGASSVFTAVDRSNNAPYLLKIRILKVDAPSFSVRMTVSMEALWTLYRTAGNVELLREKIKSSYTGGMFEGGFIGANRVRVAMEGAARENIRAGMALLDSLGLEERRNSTEL